MYCSISHFEMCPLTFGLVLVRKPHRCRVQREEKVNRRAGEGLKTKKEKQQTCSVLIKDGFNYHHVIYCNTFLVG